ncbi:MAG: carboxypeptidase regulatory-like domain-containing protein, partial [Acidobacteria bacterium]|nr:carboxypeptidase regulatory-like domain-containing protein [Acidobacteriota bacterium]
MRFSLFALFISIGLWAQTPTATLTGRVTDSSGGVLPGTALRLKNLDTNILQSAVASGTGDYTIPFVPPGKYSLEATAQGFRSYKSTALTLAVDQVLRIDVTLEVGAVADTITVTEAPPVLNTDSGARGEVITKEEISDIPLAGRNFNDLAFLTGGVIPKGDGGDGAFAVNGARADNTGFMLDGMNNTQRRNTGAVINPPIEGVQEFKMITSGFAAEYGRFAGGMLTVVTKSGSNRFHGSLYEFVRNDVWDATGYFDVRKAKLRRNQFGATLSGPVIKDKTFFLFTWESLRLVDGKTQRGIVPRPEYLQGDFSKATDAFGRPLTIVDPLNARRAFPGNQIPVSRLDPVGLKLAAFFPAPNLTGSANNYIASGNGSTSNNNFGIKVDHNFSAKDRVTFSTFWRPNTSYDPVVSGRSPIPLFGLGNNTLDILSYVKYLRPLTPNIYLELSANFSRKTNNQRWPLSGEKDWAGEVGFVGTTQNPAARGLPQLDASGYIPLGPAYDYPKVWSFNNYQYAGSTTWIKGRHTIKFGADFLRMQYFTRNYGDTRGRVTFLGRFTN